MLPVKSKHISVYKRSGTSKYNVWVQYRIFIDISCTLNTLSNTCFVL